MATTVERVGRAETAARTRTRTRTRGAATGPVGEVGAASPDAGAGAGAGAGAQANTSAGARRPVAHALVAAEQAVRRNSLHLRLPVLGELRLPATEETAFIGGVVILAAFGILDWPVAVLLGIGHGLAMDRRNKVLRAFGEALEEA